MTDWRSAPITYMGGTSAIRDERGQPLAVVHGQTWGEWFAYLLSRNSSPFYRVVGPDGMPLFSLDKKVGSFRSWVKVMGPDLALVARIDRIGTIFTSFKRRYAIRDASGVEIGRIDSPVMGYEFVVLDAAGTCVARGTRRGQSSWEVRRDVVMESPWPELTAAFFISELGVSHVSPS